VTGLNSHRIQPGGEAILCARPEFIHLAHPGAAPGGNLFRGKVETLVFVGEAYEGEIRIGDTLLTTTIDPTADFATGDEIDVTFDPDHCFLLSG
jgi:iron(III) transport system ATP-binding protein